MNEDLERLRVAWSELVAAIGAAMPQTFTGRLALVTIPLAVMELVILIVEFR